MSLSQLSILAGDLRFEPVSYDSEDKLERQVEENSRQIFGGHCIYFPIRASVSNRLRDRVTDGLLLDLSDRENLRFWIVEIELSSHSVRSHVEPQVRDFVRALEEESTRSELVELLYARSKTNPQVVEMLREVAKGEDVHWLLTHILKGECGVIVIAEELTKELDIVAKDLSRYRGAAEVKLMVFRSFRDAKDNTLFAFTSLREESAPELEVKVTPTRARTSSSDTWMRKLEWADTGGSRLVSDVISKIEAEFPSVVHKPLGKHYAFYSNVLGKGRFMAIVLSKGHLELRFGIPKDSPLASDSKLKPLKGWFFHSPRLIERGMTVKSKADIEYASKFMQAAYEASKGQS